ncbi:lambda-exonuclease family protein [Azotobacter armeniacus]
MKVVDLEQRTPAWQQWRQEGVSATSCAVIMGHNPDKTPLELWKELVGLTTPPDLSVVPQVRRGQKFEPLALQMFEEKYGQLGLPICAESQEHPFIRASFDGLLGDGAPVEIKNLAEDNHLQVLALRDKSPAFQLYRWQVMHQLIVCGARRGYLWFWSPKHEPCCLVVERDDLLIQRIIEAEKIFWNTVETGTPPAATPLRDVLPMEQTDEAAWKALAEKRREQEARLVALKAQLSALQKEAGELDTQLKLLVRAAGFRRADAYGVKITAYDVAGAVDWKAIAEELAQGKDIPADLIQKHQGDSGCRTRMTVDPHFNPNQPAPEPRIRKPAQPEPEEQPPFAAGFWF